MPKSLSKSDTTRREQVAIKPPPITSHLSSLNALQPHRDLVGTPQQVTPGTPTKTVVKEGIPGAPSHKDWYGIDTSVTKHPLGLSQADSPALRASLRLEAECGALKVSDSSCGNDDGGDVVKREGGDDACAVEEKSKPGSQQSTAPDCTIPPVTYDSPPAHRTLLTNGLALPTINPPSDGTSLVPGGKSLKIPQTAASVTLNNVAQNLSKHVEGIPRVNSDPQFCSKAEQNEEPLKKAKSCDMLQLNTTETVDPPSNMVTELDTTERDDPPLNMVLACEVDGEGGEGESERKHLLMAGATYVLQSSPGENRQQGASGNLLEQSSKVRLYTCTCTYVYMYIHVHCVLFIVCTLSCIVVIRTVYIHVSTGFMLVMHVHVYIYMYMCLNMHAYYVYTCMYIENQNTHGLSPA